MWGAASAVEFQYGLSERICRSRQLASDEIRLKCIFTSPAPPPPPPPRDYAMGLTTRPIGRVGMQSFHQCDDENYVQLESRRWLVS